MGLIHTRSIPRYIALLKQANASQLQQSALIQKLRLKYFSLRLQEAKLAFKLHNLAKRLQKIEADEIRFMAIRNMLGLWHAGLTTAIETAILPLTVPKLLEKQRSLSIRFAQNEIRLLDLKKRKQRSNGVKYCLWESQLQQIRLSLSLLEEAKYLFAPQLCAAGEVATETFHPDNQPVQAGSLAGVSNTSNWGIKAVRKGRTSIFSQTPSVT
jgi:hypothetical protein